MIFKFLPYVFNVRTDQELMCECVKMLCSVFGDDNKHNHTNQWHIWQRMC